MRFLRLIAGAVRANFGVQMHSGFAESGYDWHSTVNIFSRNPLIQCHFLYCLGQVQRVFDFIHHGFERFYIILLTVSSIGDVVISVSDNLRHH